MSIPLDNLYQWVEHCFSSPAILYVFDPHGSKNIFDLRENNRFSFENQNYNWLRDPIVICHDQEPLNFDQRSFDPKIYKQYWLTRNKSLDEKHIDMLLDIIENVYGNDPRIANQLRTVIPTYISHAMLLHSEQNSQEVEKFKHCGFIPVYYWSHAIIARDWYRYAEHDRELRNQTPTKNTFLVYCRDWSDGREYRLKFLELLARNSLQNSSTVSFMTNNSNGVSYVDYVPVNPNFNINPECIKHLPNNTYSADESARYVANDFVTHNVSVVLETMFDDQRVHLTEKIFRPIACGHPFILAAGPASLKYLRDYGFKTFSPWIDESYDLEPSSIKRLEMIVNSMKKINSLTGTQQEEFLAEVQQIARFNQQHFFSDAFIQQVTTELETNFNSAAAELAQIDRIGQFLAHRKLLKQNKKKFQLLLSAPLHKHILTWIRAQRKLLSSNSVLGNMSGPTVG